MFRLSLKVKVLVTQCLTLCDPVDCSPSAPLSIGFSGQEYCSGLPFSLLDPGIKPRSPALQADYLPSEPPAHQTQVETKHKWNQISDSRYIF